MIRKTKMHTAAALGASILNKLRRRRLSLAVAESCTGGLICDMLTNVPGMSEILLEGVVCYSNNSKVRRLDVPPRVLSHYGAVSEHVAAAMAQGAMRTARARVGLSTTGIAGPSGGSARKPIGLVYVGVCAGGRTAVGRFRFGGTRKAIKRQAALGALRMLYSYLKRAERKTK